MSSDFNQNLMKISFSHKENPGVDSRVDICFSGINELNTNTNKKLFTLPIDIQEMNLIYDRVTRYFFSIN